MGLFKKEYCEFCGEKIGLFGKTTLKDGLMCKECAAQISPWWSVGKATTVADVYEHRIYRDENKQKVADFKVTRSLGDYYKVLIDDESRRVMITTSTDFVKANPDVINFEDITSARWDVQESRSEIYNKDKDGKSVSFEPKHYDYHYDFYVTIYVKNPYFDTIRFKVNRSYVSIKPWEEYEAKEAEYRALQMKHMGAKPLTGDRNTPNIEENEDYQEYKAVAEELVAFFNNK